MLILSKTWTNKFRVFPPAQVLDFFSRKKFFFAWSTRLLIIYWRKGLCQVRPENVLNLKIKVQKVFKENPFMTLETTYAACSKKGDAERRKVYV